MKVLTKELIETFSYSTMNHNREGEMFVRIDGRDYLKFGTYQAVTLVGNLYDVYDADVKSNKTVLYVGVSRQHPCDTTSKKEVAYEEAQLKALLEPCMIIEVGKKFRKSDFINFAKAYIRTMKLKFVKTRQEIEFDNLMADLDEFADGIDDDINIPEEQ